LKEGTINLNPGILRTLKLLIIQTLLKQLLSQHQNLSQILNMIGDLAIMLNTDMEISLVKGLVNITISIVKKGTN
jgi:hypothetical protein